MMRFPSNKFSTALLFSCVFLGACTQLGKELPDAEIVTQPSPSETESEHDVPSTAPLQENAVAIDSPQPSAAVEIDLLSRIRDGFQLPEFASPHIAQYEKWNSSHPTYLKNLFARAEPFLFYIVEQLEARNMPLDLALLPAVESAYKPEAYSRSAAAGLWQFIPLTARHFKLKKDWWYDGRMDAISATTAALDYLQELNEMFDGDWLLTLAAYNAGQGTVGRAIARNKKNGKGTRYQDLNLRTETKRYVPKLYALRNILLRPNEFGVTLPVLANQPHFVVLPLKGQTDIQDFSHRSGIDMSTLRHLNAAHRRWATSPTGPHRLLVPVAAEQQAKLALEAIAQLPQIRFQDHRIGQGDTLSAIARRYGVSVAALQQANNLSNTKIRAGKTLIIPLAAGVGASSQSTASDTRESKIVHRVERGDTLWSIAKRYRVKVDQLRDWNQLSINQVLNLNQALTIFVN